VIALLHFTTPLGAALEVGGAFPPLAPAGVVDLAGGSLPATAGKVVLFDFWASWCAPCKASFPAMAKLQQEYAARGFLVVAISVDEKAAAAAAFAKRLNPPFPILHDRGQTLVREIEVPTMPTSFLVGRDGRVRAVHAGFRGETTVKELREGIEALLADKGESR